MRTAIRLRVPRHEDGKLKLRCSAISRLQSTLKRNWLGPLLLEVQGFPCGRRRLPFIAMLPFKRNKVDLSVSRSPAIHHLLLSDTPFIYLETDRGGAEALPAVRQVTHTQEHPHQNAKGLLLPSAYTVRNRPLSGHPVIRIANTLTRVTMRYRKLVSRLKTPLALLSPIPKSAYPLHTLTLHSSSAASAFLMHRRRQHRIRVVCLYHQPTV